VKRSLLLPSIVTALVLSVAEVVTISQTAQAGMPSNLTVMVDGLRNKTGQVCASVFAQSTGFPGQRDRAVAAKCIRSTNLTQGFKFDNLKPGSYAVALFHDANADGKLNTGLFGIPSEGMGCSRNPRGLTGAPRFQDAVIMVVGSDNTIQVELNYL
jgi:uncharacterized protein (DUF2141 family)